MFTCLAIRWYAASRLGLSSSNGTSMVSLARVGFSVSTALFTGVLLVADDLVRIGAPLVVTRARCTDGSAYLREHCRSKSGRADGMLLQLLDQGHGVRRTQPQRPGPVQV